MSATTLSIWNFLKLSVVPGRSRCAACNNHYLWICEACNTLHTHFMAVDVIADEKKLLAHKVTNPLSIWRAFGWWSKWPIDVFPGGCHEEKKKKKKKRYELMLLKFEQSMESIMIGVQLPLSQYAPKFKYTKFEELDASNPLGSEVFKNTHQNQTWRYLSCFGWWNDPYEGDRCDFVLSGSQLRVSWIYHTNMNTSTGNAW